MSYTPNVPIVITGSTATEIATQQAAISCGYSTVLTKYQCGMVCPDVFDKYLYARSILSAMIADSPTSLPTGCLGDEEYVTFNESVLALKGCCSLAPVLIVPELTDAGAPTVFVGSATPLVNGDFDPPIIISPGTPPYKIDRIEDLAIKSGRGIVSITNVRDISLVATSPAILGGTGSFPLSNTLPVLAGVGMTFTNTGNKYMEVFGGFVFSAKITMLREVGDTIDYDYETTITYP